MTLGTFPWMKPKPGSMGVPNPQYDVDILLPDGTPAADGQEGEIVIRTDRGKPLGLFKEYYRDPELTRSAWHDGIYHTGDVAWRDSDGYYWFVGRNDDVIKSSGYRISPFEVESVLMKHPAVVECAVTGVPDEGWACEGDQSRRQGVQRPGWGGTRKGNPDLRQDHHGTIQIPAPHRVRRRTAQDHQREDTQGRDTP